MTNVQPDWAGAPPWAQWWAVDSTGYASWYQDQPKFDCDRDDNTTDGGWVRPLGDGKAGVWLRPWEKSQYDDNKVKFDSNWPPEGFDNWDIDWASTLRSRP